MYQLYYLRMVLLGPETCWSDIKWCFNNIWVHLSMFNLIHNLCKGCGRHILLLHFVQIIPTRICPQTCSCDASTERVPGLYIKSIRMWNYKFSFHHHFWLLVLPGRLDRKPLYFCIVICAKINHTFISKVCFLQCLVRKQWPGLLSEEHVVVNRLWNHVNKNVQVQGGRGQHTT